jgi:hypothetical protein
MLYDQAYRTSEGAVVWNYGDKRIGWGQPNEIGEQPVGNSMLT